MLYKAGTIIKSENDEDIILKSKIGSGGFGEVFLAKNEKTKDEFAIKFLINPFDEKLLKSFNNEVESALKIDNKYVIKYFFFHDGTRFDNLPPYIIMEYAEGGTLLDIIEEHKKNNNFIPNDELTNLYRQLINGMIAINKEIIHRDLKPENILFKDGIIKISDFGISKVVEEATRTSTFKGYGCLPYIAPEAWKFEKNSIKMDIYSMGIIFYEMACLVSPYKVNRGEADDWKNAHFYQAVKPPISINKNISAIVDKTILSMLRKETSQRIGSWEEVLDNLNIDKKPSTPDGHFIQEAIQRRTKRTAEFEKKIVEEEKRKSEKDTIIKKIGYKIENELYLPLKEFIEEFKATAKDENIEIKFDIESHTIHINFSTYISFYINIFPIFEEDCYKNIQVQDFGQWKQIKKLIIPEYNHKKVIAWGFLEAKDGRGINLLLVESDEDDYGYWVSLLNTNSIITNNPRTPEPFPFSMNEIETELPLINTTHIYNTKHQILDINMLKKFISEYY